VAEAKAEKREGLSLTTLVVAALASGVAAVVVSHVWQDGTVIAAAMTPVLVSVLKEAFQRPIESDVVRRSASKVSKVATSALPATGARGSSASTSTLPPPSSGQHGNGNGNGNGDRVDVVMAGPRRTYGGGGDSSGRDDGFLSRLSGRRLKLAIVTGLLAFVVAVAALTLPELIFGGSVTSGGGSTTIFGGGSSSSKDGNAKDGKDGDKSGNGQDQQQKDESQDEQQTETQPQDSSDEPEQAPSQPEEAPTQPQETPPSETEPPPSGGGTPVPSVPAPAPPTP
jgi:hypothetical protein